MQPKQPIALNNLAYALATHRKTPAEALPLARRAVALAPAQRGSARHARLDRIPRWQ